MWAQRPPDFDGAIECYLQGLRLARAAGDVAAEISNLLGLAFAHTSVGSADAPEACRIALTALRETGSTHGIFLLLDAVARWFLINGAIEPAAVISGYLEGGAVPTGDRDHDDAADRRRTILRRIDGQELLARGAGMTSDEAVAYTLIQMRDAPHRSPRVTARSRSSRPHRSA